MNNGIIYQSIYIPVTKRVCIAGICRTLDIDEHICHAVLRFYYADELRQLLLESPIWDYRHRIYQEALGKFPEECHG